MKKLSTTEIERFVVDSNALSDIHRRATDNEVLAHSLLFSLNKIHISNLEQFVSMYAPGTEISTKPLANSYSKPAPGSHSASVKRRMKALLDEVVLGMPKTRVHSQILWIYPFTACNGLVARAVWAWQDIRFNDAKGILDGFLISWYKDTQR